MIKHKQLKLSRSDVGFYFALTFFLLIVLLLVGYPVVLVLSCSFSSANAIARGAVRFLPVELSVEGYRVVLSNPLILSGYANSVFYTVVGTIVNMICTFLAAYPLSRSDFPAQSAFMFFFSFTMLFSGGMIPSYMLIRDLGLINTRWALILPGAVNVYNMIICRSFFRSSLPADLWEAASIDGCGDFYFFIRIALPLSMAVGAVLTLFYALAHWNEYFFAFLYLSDRRMYPLQIILREILLMNTIDPSAIVDEELMAAKQGLADLLKYSLIVVASLPMAILYPFIQKYFVQGVMIGAIKG